MGRGGTADEQSGSRVTVGLLVDSLADPREGSIWSGAADAARERDVNLLCFSGGGLQGMGSAIYDLVSTERVDGLIVGLSVERAGLTRLGERYPGMPLLSLLAMQDGDPGVTVDHYVGMWDAVRHLLEVHGCRRIAFLGGRENQASTADLYRAYLDALHAHGLSPNPALVVSGTHTRASGAEMIRLLMDERKEQFDAIVCSSDHAALSALEALKARGVRVPDDVRIVGSGDALEAQFSRPTLTTVYQPWHAQGRQAVEVLLSRLDDELFAGKSILQSSLVVRQSCGCVYPPAEKADVDGGGLGKGATTRAVRTGTGREALRHQWQQRRLREHAKAEAVRQVGEALLSTFDISQAGGLLAESMQRLGIDSCFLSLYEVDDGPSSGWSRLAIALDQGRKLNLSHNGEPYACRQLLPDGLWPTGRSWCMLVEPLAFEGEPLGFALFEAKAESGWIYERLSAPLGAALRGALLTDTNRALTRDLARERRLLQSLMDSYPDPIYLKDAASRYVQVNRAHARLLGLVEPSDALGKTDFDLLPYQNAHRFHDEEQHILRSGEPVISREWQVPTGTGDSIWVSGHKIPIKDVQGRTVGLLGLARDVSEDKRIEGILERQLLQLRTVADVARAASGVLDPDALMHLVVNLVYDRLDLYYAGLFLVDESGEWTGEPHRWAVLRAGTGQAGRQMIEAGHKLEIGGVSMIGSCIEVGQGRIALDAGQEAVRFDNPLLPHTRSELALPLISRGETIGAMTIQSAQPGAFSATDITILQAMADQLANAIRTARLFQQTQRTLEETETLYAVSRAIGRTLELDEVLHEALRQVLGLADFDAGLVSLVDRATGRLSLAVERGLPTSMARNLRQAGLDGTLCELVYRRGEALALEDMSHGAPIDVEGLLRLGFRSYLGVPLESRGQVVGTLCVFGHEAVALGPSALPLMRAIGQQVGGAIENARLYAEVEDRARREAAIGEVSDKLQRAADMQSLARIAAEELKRLLGVSRAYVRLGDMSGLGEDEG